MASLTDRIKSFSKNQPFIFYSLIIILGYILFQINTELPTQSLLGGAGAFLSGGVLIVIGILALFAIPAMPALALPILGGVLVLFLLGSGFIGLGSILDTLTDNVFLLIGIIAVVVIIIFKKK